jgi:hypothetical protein
MITTNLFVIANVKQLRNGSFRILLPFFQISWGAGVPNSAIQQKLVKPIFLLGCYGCIFHGTGNSEFRGGG